jgi:Spherulation-specific family 4
LNIRIDQYSIADYSNVEFLVVINPDSGPGNNTLSDPNYIRELPRLNSKSNVRTIGYVHTGWASRDINTVFKDVSSYASWANNNTNSNITYSNTNPFGLNGIFFDQTPNSYTDAIGTYMAQIDSFVKNHTGFGNLNFVLVSMKKLIVGCA